MTHMWSLYSLFAIRVICHWLHDCPASRSRMPESPSLFCPAFSLFLLSEPGFRKRDLYFKTCGHAVAARKSWAVPGSPSVRVPSRRSETVRIGRGQRQGAGSWAGPRVLTFSKNIQNSYSGHACTLESCLGPISGLVSFATDTKSMSAGVVRRFFFARLHF